MIIATTSNQLFIFTKGDFFLRTPPENLNELPQKSCLGNNFAENSLSINYRSFEASKLRIICKFPPNGNGRG